VPKFDFLPLLRYLLRRLVRIAIGSGITYQAFCKVLRMVYFEIGQEFEPVKGKPNSDSRISLLTGLPRREVRSLRESPPEALAPAPSIERLVMDAWSSKLDFIDERGQMAPLPRTARQGGARSFERLVEGISKDIRARALLDEWLRQGHVILDDDDRVVPAGVRPASKIEGAQGASLLLGEMTADLMDGFERSYLLGQSVPGYAFQVSYGHRLTDESALLVCSVAMREGAQFANRINRLIVERETLDARRPDAHRRVTVGYLAYETDEASSPGLLVPAAPGGAA
jgi:hypothetical protein